MTLLPPTVHPPTGPAPRDLSPAVPLLGGHGYPEKQWPKLWASLNELSATLGCSGPLF